TLVATGSMCQVTLKTNIKDKDGNQVPSDQLGPYTWTVGTLAVTSIAPMDGDSVDPIAAGADLTFNAAVSDVMYAYSPVVPNAAVFAGATPNEVIVGGDFPANAGPYDFTVTGA